MGHVIPPSDETFDFVCFRGQDIKDLHVHDHDDHDVQPEEVSTGCEREKEKKNYKERPLHCCLDRLGTKQVWSPILVLVGQLMRSDFSLNSYRALELYF